MARLGRITTPQQTWLGPKNVRSLPNLKSRRSNEGAWPWLNIMVDCLFHPNFEVLTPNEPLNELDSYFLFFEANRTLTSTLPIKLPLLV